MLNRVSFLICRQEFHFFDPSSLSGKRLRKDYNSMSPVSRIPALNTKKVFTEASLGFVSLRSFAACGPKAICYALVSFRWLEYINDLVEKRVFVHVLKKLNLSLFVPCNWQRKLKRLFPVWSAFWWNTSKNVSTCSAYVLHVSGLKTWKWHLKTLCSLSPSTHIEMRTAVVEQAESKYFYRREFRYLILLCEKITVRRVLSIDRLQAKGSPPFIR